MIQLDETEGAISMLELGEKAGVEEYLESTGVNFSCATLKQQVFSEEYSATAGVKYLREIKQLYKLNVETAKSALAE